MRRPALSPVPVARATRRRAGPCRSARRVRPAALVALAALAAAPAAVAAPDAPATRAAVAARPQATALPASMHVAPELPLRRDDPGAGPLVRSLAVSAVLIAILGAVLLRRRRSGTPRAPGSLPGLGWLARVGPGMPAASLQVLGSTRLTPRATVHVLRWDGDEWLVGCTDQGMTILGRRDRHGSAAVADAPRSGGETA